VEAERSDVGLEADAVAVRIDGQGHPFALHGCAQHVKVALRILPLAITGPGDQPGRIVNRPHQAEVRTAALQPVVPTAINLEQHAFSWEAVTPSTSFGRSTHSWGHDDRFL